MKDNFNYLINEIKNQILQNPNDVSLREKLANLYIENNQFNEAAKQFTLIANFFSNKAGYLKALAVCNSASKLEKLSEDANKKMKELYSLLGLPCDYDKKK